jgi:hypothetical protein
MYNLYSILKQLSMIFIFNIKISEHDVLLVSRFHSLSHTLLPLGRVFAARGRRA